MNLDPTQIAHAYIDDERLHLATLARAYLQTTNELDAINACLDGLDPAEIRTIRAELADERERRRHIQAVLTEVLNTLNTPKHQYAPTSEPLTQHKAGNLSGTP
jgi:hypothetical protein